MSKPVLLLLPGMLCDAAVWQPQATALADLCETRIVSYGDADGVDAMADAALRAAPERFALGGHSMGGRVAQAIYRRVPHRVLKLALLATDYRGPVDDRARLEESTQRDAILTRAQTLGMARFARTWALEMVSPSRSNDASLIDAVAGMAARHTLAALAAQTWAGVSRPDFAGLLPTIACPTLLIAGDDDTLRPASVHREMAKLIPRSQLIALPRCGHMVTLEQPELVSAAMRNWLRG